MTTVYHHRSYKTKLSTIERVVEKYPKLRGDSKAGTLACKIAKEALFSTEVMKQCTPIGSRDKPGLPAAELRELKKAIFTQFPQFWKCPVEFESTWKKFLEAIQQSCKRLRLNK